MIQENFNLKAFNTFGINAQTKYFAQFNNIHQLEEIVSSEIGQKNELLILGGGSNLLFTQNFKGLVLKNELKGIEVIDEDDTSIWVKCAAGENWHQFVLFCIQNNYAGLENLSLIPGNVGASPMQNIGAYGVEVKDLITKVSAWHIRDKKMVHFNATACEFGYRESVFKRQFKNQFVICEVVFKLHKKPNFNTTYGAIEKELEQMGVKELSIKAVSDAVINIRSSKLPNPAELGNAGSFFKNPVVSKEKATEILANYADAPHYPQKDGSEKLAAGWLIEKCGWKGFVRNNHGVHKLQALVLVNYGGATGNEIWQLSEDIIQSVQQKFGIELEREVNII